MSSSPEDFEVYNLDSPALASYVVYDGAPKEVRDMIKEFGGNKILQAYVTGGLTKARETYRDLKRRRDWDHKMKMRMSE